jgi:hypothetical protein
VCGAREIGTAVLEGNVGDDGEGVAGQLGGVAKPPAAGRPWHMVQLAPQPPHLQKKKQKLIIPSF